MWHLYFWYWLFVPFFSSWSVLLMYCQLCWSFEITNLAFVECWMWHLFNLINFWSYFSSSSFLRWIILRWTLGSLVCLISLLKIHAYRKVLENAAIAAFHMCLSMYCIFISIQLKYFLNFHRGSCWNMGYLEVNCVDLLMS